MPRLIGAAVGWAGALLLVASMALITPTTAYPDLAATAPTAGGLALIAAGRAPGSPGALLLARTPLRWLGRISYSLYLWHWPVLVLGASFLATADVPRAVATGSPLQPLVLIAVSVLLAAVTWRLIEEPFRAGRLSHGGRRRAFAVASAAILSVAVTSTALSSAAQSEVATIAGYSPPTVPRSGGCQRSRRDLGTRRTDSGTGRAHLRTPRNLRDRPHPRRRHRRRRGQRGQQPSRRRS